MAWPIRKVFRGHTRHLCALVTLRTSGVQTHFKGQLRQQVKVTNSVSMNTIFSLFAHPLLSKKIKKHHSVNATVSKIWI